MPYINPDIDPSWEYANDYKNLTNIQIEVIEAIGWLSQQPRADKSTDIAFVDALNPIIDKLLALKCDRQMWIGESHAH